MSSYPQLLGEQCRGPGGDGRALMALMERAAWASFLTRDGVRVDVNDITDLQQLAKELAHDHATATPEPAAVAYYNPAHAQRITPDPRWHKLIAAQCRVDDARRATVAAIAECEEPSVPWHKLVARRSSRDVG